MIFCLEHEKYVDDICNNKNCPYYPICIEAHLYFSTEEQDVEEMALQQTNQGFQTEFEDEEVLAAMGLLEEEQPKAKHKKVRKSKFTKEEKIARELENLELF